MAAEERVKFRFVAEMRQMNAAIRNLDRKFGKLGRKSSRIGMGFAKGLGAFGGAYAMQRVVGGMTSAIEKNVDVQDIFLGAMSKIASDSAGVGASLQEQETLWKLLSKTAGSSRFTMLETAQAMDELAKAGKTTGEIISLLPTGIELSAATGFDLASTFQQLLITMGAFKIDAGDSAQVANQLAWSVNNAMIDMATLGETMKQAAGSASGLEYAFENVLAATMTLGDVGIQGSMAGAALKNMFNFLAGSKTGKAADAVERIMNAMGDVGIKKTFPNMMRAIAEATANMTRKEKATFFSGFFGLRALPSAFQLTQFENLVKMGQRAEALQKVDPELTAKMRERKRSLGVGIWKDMKSSIDALLVEIGAAMLGTFRPAIKRFTESVVAVKDFVSGNQGLVAWAAVIGTVLMGLTVAGAAISAIVAGMGAVGLGGGLVAAAAGLGKVLVLAKSMGLLGGAAAAGWGLGRFISKKLIEPHLFGEEADMEQRASRDFSGADAAAVAARAMAPKGGGQGVYSHRIRVEDGRTSLLLDDRYQNNPDGGFWLGEDDGRFGI